LKLASAKFVSGALRTLEHRSQIVAVGFLSLGDLGLGFSFGFFPHCCLSARDISSAATTPRIWIWFEFCTDFTSLSMLT
jgi:hypothetical protein